MRESADPPPVTATAPPSRVAASSAARRRTGHGAERKAQLLEAAADLFASHGYANTRIIDICERAGVAKGLFYWYFDTKDSLYAEMIRDLRRRLLRVQAAAMDDNANALERIRQAAYASMMFIAANPGAFAFMNDDSRGATLSDAVRDRQARYVADTERLIREAQASGHAPATLDPRLAAIAVQSTLGSFSELLRRGHANRTAATASVPSDGHASNGANPTEGANPTDGVGPDDGYQPEAVATFVSDWVVRGLSGA